MYTERFAPLILISSDYLLGQDDVVKDYSVSRMTLHQVLFTGLDDVVQFDKKFSRFEDNGDSVTAFFEDGSSAYRPQADHRPLTTFGMRTALRITDRVPALKRRMATGMQRVRDSELEST
jgi:hypothetical protein